MTTTVFLKIIKDMLFFILITSAHVLVLLSGTYFLRLLTVYLIEKIKKVKLKEELCTRIHIVFVIIVGIIMMVITGDKTIQDVINLAMPL